LEPLITFGSFQNEDLPLKDKNFRAFKTFRKFSSSIEGYSKRGVI
jgi:hypothetical protein